MATVVNYIVEGHVPGKGDITFEISDTEPEGREAYRMWCRARGDQLKFRLVKRTAVITDEVLEAGA